LISLVSYDTASDHLEALRAEKEAVKHQARTRSIPAKFDDTDVTQTYKRTPTTETSHSGEKTQKKKTKVKSRPENPVGGLPPATAQALQTPGGCPDTKEHASATLHGIKVKPESHKIFMNMFPSDDGTNTPQKTGLLDWRKFVDAMTDAGFSASGSGGSAVIFANDNGGKSSSTVRIRWQRSTRAC
jgi:hypothetical protein